jgi:hypothetical protein
MLEDKNFLIQKSLARTNKLAYFAGGQMTNRKKVLSKDKHGSLFCSSANDEQEKSPW